MRLYFVFPAPLKDEFLIHVALTEEDLTAEFLARGTAGVYIDNSPT